MLTILIPVFNKEDTIKNTINSLKTQTNKNFKVLFLDDSSKDNSRQIISYNLEGIDAKLLINEKNKGVSFSRNRLMEECSSEYFSFLDGDDLLNENFVEEFYKALLNKNSINNKKVIVSSFVTSSNNRVTTTKISESDNFLYDYLSGKNVPNTNCWILHEEIKSHPYLRFDEDLSWGEDMLFFAKVLTFFPNVHVINRVLSIYNFNPNNNSLSNFRLSQIDDDIEWQMRLSKFLKRYNKFDSVNLLREYRIPATIINRLFFEKDNLDGEEIESILSSKSYLLENISLINGLRSLRIKYRFFLLRKESKK